MFDKITVDYARYSFFRENEVGGSTLVFNTEVCYSCGIGCISRDAVTVYGPTPIQLMNMGLTRMSRYAMDNLSLSYDFIHEGRHVFAVCSQCKSGGEEE